MTTRQRSARGYTLAELASVLILVGVLASLAFPVTRRALDSWAVRSVRDQALGDLHRIRMVARTRGGARLVIRGDRGALEGWSGDSLLWTRREAAEAGVEIELPRGAESTMLEFDALGLGVVTSRTLVFRRGQARARLVISSRGRGSRR